VILISTDRTKEKELEEKAKKERAFSKMVINAVKNRQLFHQVLREIGNSLTSLLSRLENNSLKLDDLLRTIHTLKGNSFSYNIDEVGKVTHEFENELVKKKDQIGSVTQSNQVSEDSSFSELVGSGLRQI